MDIILIALEGVGLWWVEVWPASEDGSVLLKLSLTELHVHRPVTQPSNSGSHKYFQFQASTQIPGSAYSTRPLHYVITHLRMGYGETKAGRAVRIIERAPGPHPTVLAVRHRPALCCDKLLLIENKICDVLKRLCRHNEDYRYITVNAQRTCSMASCLHCRRTYWQSIFIRLRGRR